MRRGEPGKLLIDTVGVPSLADSRHSIARLLVVEARRLGSAEEPKEVTYLAGMRLCYGISAPRIASA